MVDTAFIVFIQVDATSRKSGYLLRRLPGFFWSSVLCIACVTAERVNQALCSHRGIENFLHWL